MQDSQINRRRFSRVNMPFSYSPSHLFGPNGRIIDISSGGLQVHSEKKLDKGSQVKVKLLNPPESAFNMNTRVVWQSDLPRSNPAPYALGLEFLSLPENELKPTGQVESLAPAERGSTICTEAHQGS